MTARVSEYSPYKLADRYDRDRGRIYLTGTQAIVRIALDQIRRDKDRQLNTAGFISGYRGSPLGGVDLELWREKDRITSAGIEFLPAVNEDLAATAVLGSQQVESRADKTVDGVFGLWYGKGPGLDRAGDALKHGNAYGSSPTGGVLVVAGDDHGCVSSSMPHQSDVAFMTWFMPTLNPASVAEYLEFGEYGYALSRFSGMWVGFKAISETVESAASFELPPDRIFRQADFVSPADGLHYRWPDLPGPQIEERLVAKKNAVYAFARANPIDRLIYGVNSTHFGIVTTGKGHLDTMEALRLLGVDEIACRRLGIDIYKVGMVWPLARADALNFVRGKREVLVVEEKRGIIESQFKEYFYDWPGDKPELMVGKRDETGKPLVPWTGELSPRLLLRIIASRLNRVFPDEQFIAQAEKVLDQPTLSIIVEGATRTPYFCSGCPHNTSTRVPEGSKALAGIGCHFMASWMDRETSSLIQMGGEGVNWAASSRFTGKGHIFQNLGEGTWYHSGSMAIRQAIAADTNITYKILYNDAVAMTGGQPVDGPVSVHAIAHSVRAEGVERIALVSDDATKFNARDLPRGVTIDDRSALDRLQRELREVAGVSVLIYEQTCATEKRRRRKRGTLEAADRTVVINELVCEGCGDCSVESNCLSVEPVKTKYGSKRRINQSSCNQDYSCLNGFCPSFVTVQGTRKKSTTVELKLEDHPVAEPDLPTLDAPYDLLVTGVGGTGVITVAALITMAAHLESKGSSVLDFTGFAQKFGPVLSYIRIGASPEAINQVRIDQASADALIACDIVVSSSPNASAHYRTGMKAVINTASMPTGDVIRQRDASLHIDSRVRAIENTAANGNLPCIDANELSTKLFGDSVFANVIMLGYAWQHGLVPVSLAALHQAIVLNTVDIEKNNQALHAGRLAATHATVLDELINPVSAHAETFDQILEDRCEYLAQYQSKRYANRYRKTLVAFNNALQLEQRASVTAIAARSLFKLMAYKDEYEVARLHTTPEFTNKLDELFEAGYSLTYHMAPPLLSRRKDARGRPAKRKFGSWLSTALTGLAKCRRVRGTPLDIFGYTSERRMERQLIEWYESLLQRCASHALDKHGPEWENILNAPVGIRGYGSVKEDSVNAVKTEVKNALTALDI